MEQEEKRNLALAFILTVSIFLGWNYFFEKPKTVEAPRPVAAQTQVAGPQTPLVVAPKNREDVLAEGGRVQVVAPSLKGSIALKGLLFDDLTLTHYRETADDKSPAVTLLSPLGSKGAYYGSVGWLTADKAVRVPDAQSVWTASHSELTPSRPVTFTWNNGAGLVFEVVVSVDEHYVFTTTQNVRNESAAPVSLQAYGLISRHGTPATAGFMILHEGPLGFLDEKLVEIDYPDLEKGAKTGSSKGGWLGITDKYWLAAWIPDQTLEHKTTFQMQKVGDEPVYQTDFVSPAVTIAPGTSAQSKNSFFAGAKNLGILDGYEETLGVKHFDLAVDFGWFYFLTKPIFNILTWANGWLGNFGLAIMLLTVFLKLALFPLANKSYRAMAHMKQVQPELERLKERFGDDKLRMNQEMMEFYKREKINPLSGCLPMLVQIPLFFALYKVLFVSIEMRHAPFYGWIHDLAAPDPTSVFNLFGLLPWSVPAFLLIGAWPLLMGVTMFVQQKLNPPPTDPIQAKMMAILPIVFTGMMAQFPAGLVIYWTWSNLISIAQQWFITRLHAEKKG